MPLSPEQLADLFDHGNLSLAEAASVYLSARRNREAADRKAAQAAQAQQQAEMDLLRAMEMAHAGSLLVDDGCEKVTLTAATSAYYSLPAGALEEHDVMAWLARSGGRALVRRVVSNLDFSHFCRRLDDEGKPIHRMVKKIVKKVIRMKGK